MKEKKQTNKQIQNHQMSNDHQKTNTYFHNAYIISMQLLNNWCKKYHTSRQYIQQCVIMRDTWMWDNFATSDRKHLTGWFCRPLSVESSSITRQAQRRVVDLVEFWLILHPHRGPLSTYRSFAVAEQTKRRSQSRLWWPIFFVSSSI